MTTPNPFNDVPEATIGYTQDISGQSLLDNVAAIAIGRGNRAFKADESGIWLGGNRFIDAPFKVDMAGNITATSASFPSLVTISIFRQTAVPTATAVGDLWFDSDDNNRLYRASAIGSDAITAGEWVLVSDTGTLEALTKAGVAQAFTGSIQVGVSNVVIDGANKRILINDGTNDRILIGKY